MLLEGTMDFIIIIILGAELCLIAESFGLLKTSFYHFCQSWAQAVQFFYLHLANVLFDVILQSVLG